MRRFVQSYLTISLLLILLVNLILILLYGRSFQAFSENCPYRNQTECLQAANNEFSAGLLLVNIVTFGLLILGFILALTVKDAINSPKR